MLGDYEILDWGVRNVSLHLASWDKKVHMLAIGHVRDAAPSFWAHVFDLRTLSETWARKEVNPSTRASFACWLKEKPLSAPRR